VENAILHGMEKLKNNGLIEIEISKKEHCIDILITDNGSGIDEETLMNIRKTLEQGKESTSDSIGIYNVNKRIKLYFGEIYGISIFSKIGKGTSVLLHLPPDSRVNEVHTE
jgi:two-component system sensor histidine kinase YesM